MATQGILATRGSQEENLIKPGDLVILFETRENLKFTKVEPSKVFQNRYGFFKHDDIIGKPFGSKIVDGKGGRGYIYVLAPTPDLWSLALNHRTQIIFAVDISMILLHLDVKPGSVVVESGTGSGSLSCGFARTVGPSGHLYTYEFNGMRAEKAREDFELLGLSDTVTVTHADACKDGFKRTNDVNAVFLDLPNPWEAIDSAKEALVDNGRICSFSPCIEQVQKACAKMDELGFSDIRTFECLLREHEVRKTRVSEFCAWDEMKQMCMEEVEAKKAAAAAEAVEGDRSPADERKDDGETKEGEEGEAATDEQPSKKRKVEKAPDNGRPRNFVPMAPPTPKTLTHVVADARGHTGFLTFATREVRSTE